MAAAKKKKKNDKKNKTDKTGKTDKKTHRASDDPGDLRNVEHLMHAMIGGDPHAESTLFALGRDAAWIVQKLADETGDEGAKQLAKKIVAVPPQVKTNLYELRKDAVRSLIRSALESAPQAAELDGITIPGSAVALFDPERVVDSLTRGGRPRKDVERIKQGDIAWFGADTIGPTKVQLVRATPPPAQPVLELRLRVSSGVVFVGPPEAADGPRLGSLRLDPFSTALNARASEGRLVRMKPGRYVVAAHRLDRGEIQIYLLPAPESEPPLSLADLGPLSLIPPLAGLPTA
jgi:hypothetical protein